LSRILRTVSTVLALSALVTGYIGIKHFIEGMTASPLKDQVSDSPVSVAYYTLQLFVFASSPLLLSGAYTWPLLYAMFAAPASTLTAITEGARALFEDRFAAWQRRRRTGHTVVVGRTALARSLVDRIGAKHAVLIEHGSAEELTRVGAGGATTIYACGNDLEGDATHNVYIAQTAAGLVRRNRRRDRDRNLRVYAQVSDPALALAMRARWLSRPKVAPNDSTIIDVDYFTVDVLAAHACLRDADLPDPNSAQPWVVIAGWGPFARSLLIEYAQRWQVADAATPTRISVTVVADPGQDHQVLEASIADLAGRWDAVAQMCQVTAIAHAQAPWRSPGPLPHRTFICYEDETHALTTALSAARLWSGPPESVVVRVSRIGPTSDQPDALVPLTDIASVRLVNVTDHASRLSEIQHEDLVVRLGRSVHRRYQYNRLTEAAAAGETLALTGSMANWEQLDRHTQESNIAQARHIGTKLSRIRAAVAPRTGPAIGFTFTDSEKLLLAEVEHERWCAFMQSQGWKPGSPRDNVRKIHPSLVPWAQLPDSERKKDVEAVVELVWVLADVGLEVVRLGPAGPAV
jgi:hypothetical protein